MTRFILKYLKLQIHISLRSSCLLTSYIMVNTRDTKGCHLTFKGLHGSIYCASRYNNFKNYIQTCHEGGAEEWESAPSDT